MDPISMTIAAGASAGLGAYSSYKQGKDAESAAEFNAEQTRKSAAIANEDSRNNALRSQERNRKHVASLRASKLANSGVIEGGDKDFLQETVGDLQLRILDQSSANNRQQASYQNRAFSLDHQADQAGSATSINTFSSALNGFASVYKTGNQLGAWGQGTTNSVIS